jgi:PAS domain S-box-containing protein
MSSGIAVDTVEVTGRTGTALASRSPDCGDVFRSFFERSGVCVARLDSGMRVVSANTDFQSRFGRARQDVRGTELVELLHPDDRTRVSRQLDRLADDPSARFAERVAAVRRGGAAFAGELTGLGMTDDDGHFDGVMVLGDRPAPADDEPTAARRQQMLSEVDARILEGVGGGVSTVQLAATLYLSRGGVEYHVTSLLRRFKVKNRPALISKAYSAGIFRVGSWPPRVLPEYVK